MEKPAPVIIAAPMKRSALFTLSILLIAAWSGIAVVTGRASEPAPAFPGKAEISLSADEKKLLVYGSASENIVLTVFVKDTSEDGFRRIFETSEEKGTFGVELDSGIFSRENANSCEVKVVLEHPAFTLEREDGRMGSGRGEFLHPSGIAYERSAGIFVADAGNDRVEKFDSMMHFNFEFGGFSWGDGSTGITEARTTDTGQFNDPVDMAVDGRHIFVSDRGNHKVKKFDSDGNFLLEFGSEGSERGRLSSPGGLALDKRGNVFVADTGNDRVQKLDAAGNFIMEYGGFGWTDGKFNQPSDVTLLADDSMLVLDSGNSRVQELDLYGNVKRTVKLGVKVDRTSSLALFADRFMLVSSPTGTVEMHPLFGTDVVLGSIEGLKEPRGLAEGPDGTLLVVESGAFKVSCFRYHPTEFTIGRKIEFFGM
jgi:DNA-binding beta-propeller fold protein YncE